MLEADCPLLCISLNKYCNAIALFTPYAFISYSSLRLYVIYTGVYYKLWGICALLTGKLKNAEMYSIRSFYTGTVIDNFRSLIWRQNRFSRQRRSRFCLGAKRMKYPAQCIHCRQLIDKDPRRSLQTVQTAICYSILDWKACGLTLKPAGQ